MADTKSRSIRVEDALWVKFCAMNGTQNEAFRALIEQMESAKKGPDLLQKIYERALAMELKLEEILETVQGVPTSPPASSTLPIATGSAAMAEDVQFPFHPKCLHCGNNFGAHSRLVSICLACKRANHYGDPRNCDECVLLQGGA